jgi:hypothetical protein
MVELREATLGIIYISGIQGFACNMDVHGYKVTTNYKELWDEKKLDFSLSYHLKNYVTCMLHGFDKMFLCYKSHDICERKMFIKI